MKIVILNPRTLVLEDYPSLRAACFYALSGASALRAFYLLNLDSSFGRMAVLYFLFAVVVFFGSSLFIKKSSLVLDFKERKFIWRIRKAFDQEEGSLPLSEVHSVTAQSYPSKFGLEFWDILIHTKNGVLCLRLSWQLRIRAKAQMVCSVIRNALRFEGNELVQKSIDELISTQEHPSAKLLQKERLKFQISAT